MIDEYEEHVDGYHLKNKQRPIPYKFLEKQGHDVSAIRNDKLKCDSVAYVNEDDKSRLYLSVKAESTDKKYYTNYILSYPLTEQEYEDLYLLHMDKYIQAPLFIQELDNQKTARIESLVNVEIDTYERFETAVNQFKTVKGVFSNEVTSDIVSVDEANLNISVYLRSLKSNKIGDMINKTELRELKILFTSDAGLTYDDYVFIKNPRYTKSYNTSEFQGNYTPIICFNSQDVYDLNYNLND